MKLIVLIPCLNEEEPLPRTIRSVPRQINGADAVEVLVFDDGSTDRTVEVARENGADHVVRFTKRKGLAKVFHAGLDACLHHGADVIVNFDADGQYRGEDIPRLVAPILEGKADIVIGNRDIENVKQFSFLKKRLQRIGSWTVRKLAGSDIADVTTGFRAYSREAALRLNIISEYTYTIESIIQAANKNLAVANITVRTNEVQRPSRLLKSIPEYLKRSVITIVRIYAMFNPLRLFITAGTLFTAAGFLLSCRFLYYYLTGAGGGKVQSLILAAVLLIIGFQLMVIGLVSDLISANRRLIEDCLLRIKRTEMKISGKS